MSTATDIKEEELEGFSEEERMALEDDSYDEDEVLDDEDGEQEDIDNDEDDIDDDIELDDESEESDEDPNNEDVSDDEETNDLHQKEFQPKLNAEPIENYDEKLKEIDARIEELDNKFEDGEMDMREYRSEVRKVESEATDLKLQQRDYDNSVKNNQDSNAQRWQWEQDRFFSLKTSAIYKENSLLGSAFDTAVKELAENENNQDKPMSWFLEEADSKVKKLFNASSHEDKPPKTPANKEKRRGLSRDKIPPNLGDAPSAEQPDVGGDDEFDRLDKLGGIELEQALSKLSLSEQDRYLKG